MLYQDLKRDAPRVARALSACVLHRSGLPDTLTLIAGTGACAQLEARLELLLVPPPNRAELAKAARGLVPPSSSSLLKDVHAEFGAEVFNAKGRSWKLRVEVDRDPSDAKPHTLSFHFRDRDESESTPLPFQVTKDFVRGFRDLAIYLYHSPLVCDGLRTVIAAVYGPAGAELASIERNAIPSNVLQYLESIHVIETKEVSGVRCLAATEQGRWLVNHTSLQALLDRFDTGA